MSISKKLFIGFGLILGIVSLLFLGDFFAVVHEHNTKDTFFKSIEMRKAMSNLFQERMNNRLRLRNFLLSGDVKEADSLKAGENHIDTLVNIAQDKSVDLGASSQRSKDLLEDIRKTDVGWQKDFADPLVDKRRQVDAGSSTVAELQIAYLQANPGDWQKKEDDQIKELNRYVDENNRTANESADSATKVTNWATGIGMMVVLMLGGVIAWKSSKSITDPLGQLIAVAGQIGNSGDLDQKVEVKSSDEIGELGKTFNNMVDYLREMATVSEAIAGGDLSVEIHPRSGRDTLGKAFREMTLGLRNLVKTTRDSAAQVASGSNQVASASDDSAKISVQAASAIDEVTSTMHEMSINVQNMVKSTQMQASNVSETSASIDEMVASIQRVADTAKVLLDS